LKSWTQQVKQLKAETYALYLAYKDPRTPWYARVAAAAVVAYAFSPIDLIPDFIPVLGHLDDLILVPLGIILAIKLIPAPIMTECRVQAQAAMRHEKSMGRLALAAIVALWLAVAALIVVMTARLIYQN
jgi:uncharacterized membrane protein YkvA (DUF1232 family)